MHLSPGYRQLVKNTLKKLACDLEPVFGHALRHPGRWGAERIAPDLNRPGIQWAKFCLAFHFPEPMPSVNYDLAIEAYRPAIYGYCAGLDLLRDPCQALCDVFTEQALLEWPKAKKILARHFAHKAALAGKRQGRKVCPDDVAKRREAGQKPKQIAADLGVCAEAVRRVSREEKRSGKIQGS